WPGVINAVRRALGALTVTSREEEILRPERPPTAAAKQKEASLSELLDAAVARHQHDGLAEAERLYLDILDAQPGHFDALHLLGVLRSQQGQYAEALDLIASALKKNPESADVLSNHGSVLHALGRYEEALASCDQALTIRPDHPRALANRGMALSKLKRLEEALTSYERVLAIAPHHRFAFSESADLAPKICDWIRTAKYAAELEARVTEQESVIAPFTLLRNCDDPELHLRCARNFIREQIPTKLRAGTTWRHERIRIAYLSADFRRHATAYLMAQLFERHDRSRFEVVGVSFGPDDGSDIRTRLVRAFDQFYDVRSKNDLQVADLLRELEIDIAV